MNQLFGSRKPSRRAILLRSLLRPPENHVIVVNAESILLCCSLLMHLLPYFEQAVIGIEKLEDYVLNSEHPEGKHKARVFQSTLAIERRHARVLAELLQRSLSRAPAKQAESNEYGDLWTTWHEIIGLNGQSAVVTVAWMFKKNAKQTPVFISCYIESRKQETLKKLFE